MQVSWQSGQTTCALPHRRRRFADGDDVVNLQVGAWLAAALAPALGPAQRVALDEKDCNSFDHRDGTPGHLDCPRGHSIAPRGPRDCPRGPGDRGRLTT